jgi:hypothetical protein
MVITDGTTMTGCGVAEGECWPGDADTVVLWVGEGAGTVTVG